MWVHLRYSCFLILFFLGSSAGTRAQWNSLLRHIDSISTTDYDQTIRLCDSLLGGEPGTPVEGILFRARGRALYFSGAYDQAAQQYAFSIDRFTTAGLQRELGLTLLEQAKLFRKIRMFEQADNTYQKAEAIFAQLKDSVNLASTWNEWGVVFELQKNFRQALRLYRKSLRVKESVHDEQGIAYAHSFISTSEMGLQNYAAATVHGLYALRLFESLGNPFPIATQSADLAALFEKKKDYVTALAYSRRSDSLASLWDYKELRANNYLQQAALYREMGKYDSAFLMQERHSLLQDSIFTENSQKVIAELNARYELAEKDAALQKEEKEKERSTFIALFTVLLLFFLGCISFFIIRNQRLRNRALVREHFYKEELARQESEKRLSDQRNHISRELHDNIGAYLTFIASSIDRIESPRLRDDEKIKAVKELTKETIAELRKTVWLLNKPALSAFDWQIKLREYYRHFGEVSIRATPSTEEVQMTSEQATQLFRIVQEAINNSLKYSGASEIKVLIDNQADLLCIQIADNGKGFDRDTISQGFGLTTMRVRTEELGGDFGLKTGLDTGVQINIRIPLNGGLAN